MTRVVFDYSKLKGRIKEKYGTQKAFAARLGISEPVMTMKLNSRSYFSQGEILKASELLEISRKNIFMYFFSRRVQ